jgi:hypothetical protein
MAQVGQRLLDGLDNARLQSQGVARNPHPAARPSSGATDARVFFSQDDFEPQMRRTHRRRQTACAGAEYQNIAI